jgi:hypothetical protein
MGDDGSVRLGVRRLIIVGHSGQRVAQSVFCPRQLRSTQVDVCRCCPRAVRIDGASVTCAPGVEPLRDEVLVGTAMGGASVAVMADVAVVQLAEAIEPGGWVPAVVLDAAHRALGLIDREQLASGERGACVGTLARPTAPVREVSPLMSVVHRMVRERARSLPVVDAAHCTVGVVTDLDALRWVAAHGRTD